MAYYKPKGDISWYAPNATIKSRPFEFSTVAESESIVYACEGRWVDINEAISKFPEWSTEYRILSKYRDKYKVKEIYSEDGNLFIDREKLRIYHENKEVKELIGTLVDNSMLDKHIIKEG